MVESHDGDDAPEGEVPAEDAAARDEGGAAEEGVPVQNGGETSQAAPDPAVLPSGAVVEEQAENAGRRPSRRSLLIGGGAGAAVLAAAGAGGTVLWQQRERRSAVADGVTVTRSWADTTLQLTAPSGVCEAPLIIAYENGIFEEHGLKVELKKTGDGENVVEAVGSGKYHASNGIFFNYLGPIYNGTPVKLSGGLHYGCLDLYVTSDGPVAEVADLRDRRIGVSELQGSATNFFSLDLLDAGINSSPEAGEVEWVVIEQELLPQALQDGTVDAIATAGGYLPIIEAVEEGWARVLSNNQDISANADQPCCAVVLNNTFVTEDPVTAGKLVTAWAEGARWAGANLEETARIESEKGYVAGTPEEIIPVLETLTFDPSPESLQKVLSPGIEKYIRTGFLPAETDADVLAKEVFIDLGLTF